MEYDEFSLMPPEIQLNILANTDIKVLTKLCRVSTTYRSICSEKYDYLWRILTHKLIGPMRNYRNIWEFNRENNTQFGNWFELYKYVYLLPIDYYELMDQCSNGSIDIVKYLVQSGVNVNYVENDSRAPLIKACKNAHINVVVYLIGQGANVNVCGDMPLSVASENGQLEMVKYLVEHGADIHEVNDYPVIVASKNGYLNIVKYLVEHGADVNAQNFLPLKYAVQYGHKDVETYLGENGGRIE